MKNEDFFEEKEGKFHAFDPSLLIELKGHFQALVTLLLRKGPRYLSGSRS
jgi:hypothetical protein